MTLSLTMIVKNEGEVLCRALDGIKSAADEIIIVDTGSTDDTVKIAERYTDKVFSFPWINDFSAARNFALSKVTTDYFMWLDADDIVPQSTCNAIKKLKKTTTADAIMLPYAAAVDENGKPTFSYYRERILKADGRFVFEGAVHEAIRLSGTVQRINKPIIHGKPTERNGSTRNLDIYKSMIAGGKTLSPREKYYYARELYFNGFFAEAASELSIFLAQDGAFKVNKADACLMLSHCFSALGDNDSAVQAALYRFAFTPLDGEGCCRMGALFFAQNDFSAAAHWYALATKSKPDLESGAFIQPDYYGFIPLVWLSVCYDRLGDTEKAFSYHRRAKKLKPLHKSIIANDAYFAAKGLSETTTETTT